MTRRIGAAAALLLAGACGSDGNKAGPGPGDPDAGAPDNVPITLALELPAAPPVGLPFPILVRTADGRQVSVAVEVAVGEVKLQVPLRRGRGSVSTTLAAPGPVAVRASSGSAMVEKTVTAAERPARMLSGTLAGANLTWGPEADIVLAGTVVVPAGAQLSVAAGTRVLGGTRANLDVAGTATVAGTEDDPVLFTRATEMPWGGIRVSGTAEIKHALLTQGGGDDARTFGHKISIDRSAPLPTQPLVHARAGEVLLEGGAIVDSRGKGPSAEMNGAVTVRDFLVSRVFQGGEVNGGQIVMERSHIVEIPKADGVVRSDDADGYHLGPPRRVGGAAMPSAFRDVVVAFTEDDGIDHNATDLVIERVWVENIFHEGIATSESGTVTITDTVVTRAAQGIESGWGNPRVVARNVLVAGCGVGLRWGDDYDWDEDGVLTASYAVVLPEPLVPGPTFVTDMPHLGATFWDKKLSVWNFGIKLNGPKPDGIDISCSMVQSPDWDGKQNNAPGAPTLDDRGCVVPMMLPDCPDAPVGPRCFWAP